MSSNTEVPHLWRVPCRTNPRLVGETELGWDMETALIPARTAEEALEVAQKLGLTPDGEPTPWLEVVIGDEQFQIILRPIAA